MHLDPYQSLGQAIKRHIEAKGYATLEGFAHEHAIPKGTLSKIVNGKVDAKISTLLRISQALGVSVTEFFPSHPVPGNWVMERPAAAYRAGAGKRKRRG
jgi:transcriptional regulator with XRE-family HTH domain